MTDNWRRSRRSVIQGLGAGALLTTIGCVPATRALIPNYPRPYSRKPWAAPHVSMDAAFLARLDWAARISHHAYTNLTGSKYGIRWLETYDLHKTPPGNPVRSTFDDLFTYKGELNPGEHPFGDRYARRMVTMQIDPGTLLRQLTADFQLAGGKYVVRNFVDRAEVLALKETVIFNCTGLGATVLFKDSSLVPIKGQLVYLPPGPAVDYMTFGGGYEGDHGFLHMFPRADVLLLGGTFRLNDNSRNVEAEETERIVQEHKKLFGSFD